MIEEIRLHGMGGQGVVAAGELIAIAASYEGKFCRAFPMYGSARRGAPVTAFAQIGPESEATRSMIYYPGYLLIMDPDMPETMDVTSGLKERGVIVFNSLKSLEEATNLFKIKLSRIGVVDATGLSEEILGRPIPNTVILGSFSKVSEILQLGSLEKAIEKRFTSQLSDKNIEALRAGYDLVEIKDWRE